jgi:hypothetical protein
MSTCPNCDKEHRDNDYNEMVERLVEVAISTLHHDGDAGSEVDKYERHLLRTKFGKILNGMPC